MLSRINMGTCFSLHKRREVDYLRPMPIHYFEYPKCSTCRKGRRWLDDQGLDYESTDLVAQPPSAQQLADLHRRSGLPIKRFFNTSGVSYRSGGWKEKLPELGVDEAYAALAADGKLIKRPILDDGTHVLVGFREAEYTTLLG